MILKCCSAFLLIKFIVFLENLAVGSPIDGNYKPLLRISGRTKPFGTRWTPPVLDNYDRVPKGRELIKKSIPSTEISPRESRFRRQTQSRGFVENFMFYFFSPVRWILYGAKFILKTIFMAIIKILGLDLLYKYISECIVPEWVLKNIPVIGKFIQGQCNP